MENLKDKIKNKLKINRKLKINKDYYYITRDSIFNLDLKNFKLALLHIEQYDAKFLKKLQSRTIHNSFVWEDTPQKDSYWSAIEKDILYYKDEKFIKEELFINEKNI